MQPDASTEAKSWTWGQGLLSALLILLGGGITVVAFYVIWGTVTRVVQIEHSWTVPVAGEIAFVFMFLVGILLTWRKAPPIASRTLIASGIIGGSVELNIYASRGHVPALTGHLLVVFSFYSVMYVGKAAFTRLRGGKTRADRISGLEWVTHPLRSASLSWWMASWNEPSRERAMERYVRLLWARAIAQSDPRIGRTPVLWKRRLPLPLRFEMSMGILPDNLGDDWRTSLETHVQAQLRLLPGRSSEATPDTPPASAPGDTPNPLGDDVPDATGNKVPDPLGDDTRDSTGDDVPDASKTRLPNYSRKPSPAAVKKMSGADLAPYVEAILGTSPRPSQLTIMKKFHVGADKAKDAIKVLDAPPADVVALHAAQRS